MIDEYEPAAPADRKTAEEWFAEVRRHERRGELFRAFDLARRGLEHFPDNLALRHRAVLCLASTGAWRRAAELLKKLDLDGVPSVPLSASLGLAVATLQPRLMKDAALAMPLGAQRDAAILAAAEAYGRVFQAARAAGNAEAYYPGVNAATLHVLARRQSAADAVAREVLDELTRCAAEPKSYFEAATELEAKLVLGDLVGARASAAVVRAVIRNPDHADYRGQSSTVRQLRLLVDAKGLAEVWLDELRPPRIIHYVGHIIAAPDQPGRFPAVQEAQVAHRITALLEQRDVAVGYGSLAAGADILFAEALLARGASVHLVLPFDRADFVEASVRLAGGRWEERFAICLAAAEKSGTVRYATDGEYLGDDHLFSYCSQLAMGLALLQARHLSTEAEQIAVWDGRPASGPAGTGADRELWSRTGMAQHTISVPSGSTPPSAPVPESERLERRPRAMLFGDVHGFSRLTDAQLRSFIRLILGSLAEVIGRHRADILLANTWGDGLFVVFDDAGKAASCALDLQEALASIDRIANGLPDDLGLRVGLHLGPAYSARDPILGRENFFGAHVSRAARIEPVTPEGCVYVTETMAAVLALHNSHAFTCEYVGMTEAAKGYGSMRMFLLERAAAPS